MRTGQAAVRTNRRIAGAVGGGGIDGGEGARREFFGELMLGLFVAKEDFAGALDDGAGQAGETRDFDAVGLVG